MKISIQKQVRQLATQALVMFYAYSENERENILMHIKSLLKKYFTEEDLQDFTNDITVCIIGFYGADEMDVETYLYKYTDHVADNSIVHMNLRLCV